MQVNIITTGESISVRNIFISADYHLGHANVIKFDNRPFDSIHEMNKGIIDNHNSVITNEDLFIHVGDLTLERNYQQVQDKYISKLNGKKLIFINGSHDKWMKKSSQRYYQRLELEIDKKDYLVCDHYCMTVWPKSHYGSYSTYGHEHLWSPGQGRSYNVSIALSNYYPVNWTKIKEELADKENINQLKKKDK